MTKSVGPRGGRDDLGRLHSYCKIWNLGHPGVEELFEDGVIVQEKVDGSQISFVFDHARGALIRSKGRLIYDDSQGGRLANEGMFELAVASVLSRRQLLHADWVYRGEFLAKPKHNTLAYDRVPSGNIALFDVEVGTERYLRYDGLYAEAARIGLEAVPLLGPGTGWTLDLMNQFLETPSFLGGQTVEGLVFKNYERFGRDGKVLMGKYVSESFRETHRTDWKTRTPGQGDVVEQLAQSLRTPARWEKAVQHLRDRGELQDAPQDIGPLLGELRADLLEEERERISEQLLKWALPKIMRTAGHGFPEWYKARLAEKQFGEVE